jgi:hypothetical protein
MRAKEDRTCLKKRLSVLFPYLTLKVVHTGSVRVGDRKMNMSKILFRSLIIRSFFYG